MQSLFPADFCIISRVSRWKTVRLLYQFEFRPRVPAERHRHRIEASGAQAAARLGELSSAGRHKNGGLLRLAGFVCCVRSPAVAAAADDERDMFV